MPNALYGTTQMGEILVLELHQIPLQTFYHFNGLEDRWDIHSIVLKEGVRVQWEGAPEVMTSEAAHSRAMNQSQKIAEDKKDHMLNPPRIELGPIESDAEEFEEQVEQN